MKIMLICGAALCVAQCRSTRPQPATAYTPRQNTACSRTRFYSPDDGHNDARNMQRQKFDNKHRISCILLVLSLHLMFTMHGHKNLKLGWLRFEQPHHGQQTTLSHHIQTSLLSNAYQRKKGRSVKLLNSAAVETFGSIRMRRNKQISVYTPAKCNLYLWSYYNTLP